jgi:hypothetical protein
VRRLLGVVAISYQFEFEGLELLLFSMVWLGVDWRQARDGDADAVISAPGGSQ